MAGLRDAGARPVMSALPSRAMPDDLALVRVLEASIEILKTENEILNRRLAAAETWAAQAVITKRLDTLAADIGNASDRRARAAPLMAQAAGGLVVRRAGGLRGKRGAGRRGALPAPTAGDQLKRKPTKGTRHAKPPGE